MADDEVLAHYSRALDEIYKLRRALAYEARVTTGLLNYATLPTGARERIETMGNRLRAGARAAGRSRSVTPRSGRGATGTPA